MKRINCILAGLLGSALLFSCGESMEKVKEAQETASGVSDLLSAGKSVLKDQSRMADKDPLSQRDFEKWAPGATFQGMERSKFELGNDLAKASVTMLYGQENDNEHMEILVVDGADPVGSMFLMQANLMLNGTADKDTDDETRKIVEKHGVRAIEYFSRGATTIETVANGRFYVRIEGTGMDSDAVWKAFKALDVKKLGK